MSQSMTENQKLDNTSILPELWMQQGELVSDLGTELDVRQEEVDTVEDFPTALPDAMEAQPAHRHYGSIATGCRARVLLIAHLQHQGFGEPHVSYGGSAIASKHSCHCTAITDN